MFAQWSQLTTTSVRVMCSPMCLKFAILAFSCLGGLAAHGIPLKDKRQVGVGKVATVNSQVDHAPAESGFLGLAQPAAAHAGSKYFQDMYVAQHNPKEIEFGHVCENPNDWEQRFEKINLENLNRQGKVRWGDKHGGYGEHYWDYNHAGHHDGSGEESQQSETYEEYEETKDAPRILPASIRGKRNPDDEVEFISENARSAILDGRAPKHGGNYRKAKEYRAKRQPAQPNSEDLVFDTETGYIVDKTTGVHYQLQAVPN
ncbi:uncharacterized protein LOC132700059 isoform X1 [Cylas formicarius]|uniref:uncharacterized protein LOC132700059 isoform X1 n=1 Tax=Cylas formicarius TaxID=197179 RepID=UPI002958B8CD|nr:uncharacterized protein LOC132700059 isoform X1 [Cylas formicarius]